MHVVSDFQVDVGCSGLWFTWTWGNIKERLDRSLYNAAWIDRFPEIGVQHLPKIKSDHRLVLIQSHLPVDLTLPRPFRFLAPWLGHSQFQAFFQQNWSDSFDFTVQLGLLSDRLRVWNRRVFGNIFKRKDKLLKDLSDVERRSEIYPAHKVHEDRIWRELEDTFWQEELLWIQKSRNQWVVDGDQNTRFFHVAMMRRPAQNHATRIRFTNWRMLWWDGPPTRLPRLAWRLITFATYTTKKVHYHILWGLYQVSEFMTNKPQPL